MNTMILIAALAQVPTADDFYFAKAQEDFAMDIAVANDDHAGFERYMPPAIAKQVILFRDDCWRCRERARDDVVAMGPDALRWMFWSLRSIDWNISTVSSQAIHRMILCRRCGGDGWCHEFKKSPDEGDQSNSCFVCGMQETYHETSYYPPVCSQCSGRGIFPRSFDEEAMRAEYGAKAMKWIRGAE